MSRLDLLIEMHAKFLWTRASHSITLWSILEWNAANLSCVWNERTYERERRSDSEQICRKPVWLKQMNVFFTFFFVLSFSLCLRIFFVSVKTHCKTGKQISMFSLYFGSFFGSKCRIVSADPNNNWKKPHRNKTNRQTQMLRHCANRNDFLWQSAVAMGDRKKRRKMNGKCKEKEIDDSWTNSKKKTENFSQQLITTTRKMQIFRHYRRNFSLLFGWPRPFHRIFIWFVVVCVHGFHG